MALKNPKFVNRDISWLSFNDRVLQEAADKTNPLIERIKFLGIFSNNLDEFFRVRVATVKRMIGLGSKAKYVIGENPIRVMETIHETVISQQKKFEKIYQEIVKELEKGSVYIINEKQLNKEQGDFVRSYFQEKVRPALVPIMIQSAPKFPYLKDKSIYLAIKLEKNGAVKNTMYAMLEVPDSVPRFLIIPKRDKKEYIILLDDIIRYCLDELFSVFDYDIYNAYTIKLTRDAELDIEKDLSISIPEKIAKGLKMRSKGNPVRLVFDSTIPKDLLDYLIKKMKFDRSQTLIPGGRYHNFKDFINFPSIGPKEWLNKPIEPLAHPDFVNAKSLFSVIRKKDIMLHFPYQKFDYVIDLLREAAIDPKVTDIKITIYRAAKNSNIIKPLLNAIKNGKSVTTLIEVQARFDEAANLKWANLLQDEGANVVYGVQGLKVHSKIILITRKEQDKTVQYAYVGTGNFNENTSKIYADEGLLTCDKRITHEVENVFNFFSSNFRIGNYKHLVVSPFFMRNKITKLIQQEIDNAKDGKPAYMMIKLNSLVDEEITLKLYEASQAGVKVNLIIRGTCSVVPGIKGMSENIQIISLVDKYLEHSRIFVFCNGGDEKYFISSADWMIRNLDHRTEVACPIYDVALQKEIKDILNIQFKGTCKVRVINEKQDNVYKTPAKNASKVRAQDEIYSYLEKKLLIKKAK